MNDQSQASSQPSNLATVDDVVQQGMDIQDLFDQNDQDSSQVVGLLDDPAQKSPLDILEEILKKEEAKHSDQPLVEAGPSAEDIALQARQDAQEKAMIEEHRRKLITETESQEQQKRNFVRDEQIKANQVTSPFDIKQLVRKKIIK